MTAGFSTATANSFLGVTRGNGNGANFTAPAAVYFQAHTGDPGANGTANVSTAISARTAAAWAAPSAASMALSAAVDMTASGSDTITHLSRWSASSGGTFYDSAALSSSKAVTNGDTLRVNTYTVSVTSLAA